MAARVVTLAVSGVEAVRVDVEVQITGGEVAFILVGLGDKAVGESRERVRGAFMGMGLALPHRRIIATLAPADLPKVGSHYDLPIALALMAAMGIIPPDTLEGWAAVGELSLDGRIVPVAGALPAAVAAGGLGLGLICPEACGPEAAWAGGTRVLAAPSLIALVNHFRGTQMLSPPKPGTMLDGERVPDLRDVKGQENAKRALEIAAAGGHNLAFMGPPGSGKSMMAARLPGLLPPLTPAELLETSMIHSIAGLIAKGQLSRARPFRAPHHSASMAALTGGGLKAKPGEVSLAHNGVLFLDELPEFGTQVLSPPKPGPMLDGERAPDLRDVKGQENAKRALEIAAAGGHNLSFIGPPGSGKSMMAARLPGILPPLTPEELLETSMIHSVAGLIAKGQLTRARPFRSPHHSASMAALTGGGLKAKPGEVSLAHTGVLFLAELPEFGAQALDSLRQPLETGEVVVARANAHVRYPSRFQLVAAMNP